MTKKHSQWDRFGFAVSGLKAAWKGETSFRTEVYIAVLVVIGMAVVGFPLMSWMAISAAIAFVLAAELINTSIEAICDALHPAQHPLIKVAKDCASGAVLVANLSWFILFLGILWRRW